MDDSSTYDVFLSYNAEDRPVIIDIAQKLKDKGLQPWLDVWELRPGFSWQIELEKKIKSIQAATIFVGKNGVGPWQQKEIDAYLRQFLRRDCPIIPTILPDCRVTPKLPLFLEGYTWIDFRADWDGALDRLIWGITGQKPKGLSTKRDSELPSRDALGHPKPTDLKTEKVVSKRRTVEKSPPLTTDDIRGALKDPSFSVYLYIGQWNDEGWENAKLAFEFRTRLRIYLVKDIALVREWVGQMKPKGIVFGWDDKPKRFLNKTETEDFKVVLKAIREARSGN